MEHFEGTLIGYDSTELYYQRWRPDDTPKAALAVVHGYGEHSGRYANVVDWFVPRGYVVYAVDLRGHGHSGGQRGHIDSFADLREDVRTFLTLVHQEEIGVPIFLLGHSLGGLAVLNYVQHDPDVVAGVVASGPMLISPPISPLKLRLSKLLSRILPRLSWPVGLEAALLSRDSHVVEAYVNDPLVHDRGTPRLAAEVSAAVDWTQAHACDLRLPCLIVHGGADELCSPAASRSFFEAVASGDKERHEYNGYYHEVFNDIGKEKVLADVEGWLERHL